MQDHTCIHVSAFNLLTFNKGSCVWTRWPKVPPSGGVPWGSAVSREAGRCFQGCGKGMASLFLPFLSLFPAVFLVGQIAVFLAAAGLGQLGQGGGCVGCQHRCHLPSSWLASPSFWSLAEEPFPIYHEILRRWEQTEPGFAWCAVH